MEKGKRSRLIILSVLFLLFIGTIVGFGELEGLNFFDALWMTFTSLLTIGYGDIYPKTQWGKIFALFMVPLCIVSFTYLAGNLLSGIIAYNLTLNSRSKRMIKRIRRYKKHIILCGAQGMAGQIVEQLRQKEVTFVLLDHDEKRLEPFSANCTIVLGDPSEEDVLLSAGIEKAEAILAVKSDAENLLITLTARGLNEEVNIICSADKQESEKKLKKAGADFVINPERIGGNRMILSALKPAAVDYIDKIFRDGNEEFHVEKMLLNEKSTLVGKNLKQARLRELFQVSVMGIHRDNQILTSNLADMELRPHDALILFGKVENLEAMEESVQADTLA
jgi:voltage-gated potassium channel